MTGCHKLRGITATTHHYAKWWQPSTEGHETGTSKFCSIPEAYHKRWGIWTIFSLPKHVCGWAWRWPCQVHVSWCIV